MELETVRPRKKKLLKKIVTMIHDGVSLLIFDGTNEADDEELKK